tara:strand:- start:84 stop:557 length:474 start_codon:yes stop_codon:yes gene_type:complete
MKKIFIIFAILNGSYLEAALNSDSNEVMQKPYVDSLDQVANIFNLLITPTSLNIKNISISKPSSRTLIKLNLPKKSDQYVIRFLDKDLKENIILGLGNPFYASAQHIGYEDSKVSGGLVSSADIEVAIPINIEARYIVISRKDSLGNFLDIQQVEIE